MSEPFDAPPIRVGLLDDVMAVIDANPAPDRKRLRAQAAVLVVGCVLVAVLVFLAYGGLRAGGAPRSVTLILATTIGSALLAGLALWLIRGRGAIGGTTAKRLVVVLFGVPIGLMAWKLGWSASFTGALDQWPERIGIPCLEISLMSGLGPLLALVWLRRSAPNHPRLLGAVLGVTAGACAWVVTDLWCPVGHVPHLLLGHLLPIVLFALAGVAIGARWLRVRWRG